MKRLIIPISALFVSGFYQGQSTTPSTGENYIYSKTILDYDLNNQVSKVSETVQYLDGLGRAKQTVKVKAAPSGKDLVSGVSYDGFGRVVDSWLPVPMSTLSGGIQSNVNSAGTSFYGDSRPFGHKELESSPLDRVFSQIQPGQDWQGHPVQFEYDTNNGGEVYKFTTTTGFSNGASSSVLKTSLDSDNSLSGFYKSDKLYKNTVTDEDGNKTVEFKNSQGQVVLVSHFISATESADTYYVYNEYNLLSFVIPPKAVGLLKSSGLAAGATVADTVLNDLCYQYRYDSRRRLVEKKLPGKGWEYIIYDRQDRPVMSQDANMGASNQWLFTKYDQHGRVAYTGLYTGSQAYGSAARASEQANVDSKGSNNVARTTMVGFSSTGMDVYYDNNTPGNYPNTITKLLSVNYYDTYPYYSFNPGFPSGIMGEPVMTDSASSEARNTKSLPVMSLVKNIEDDNWTKNYTYYDKKGRSIGGYSINHLGGYTRVESKLGFSGMILNTSTYHKRLDSDMERVITETFTYDSQNRLLIHKHKVDNNTEEILAQNTYNDLSQLTNKKVGGVVASSPLQSIDYSYNIRGWMTKINDPANLNGKLFGYELRYNNPISSNITAGRFNGNITEIDWNNGSENLMKRYNYDYDKLNRLASAYYREPSTGVSGSFNEYLTYDLNGNINTLKRFAPQVFSPTPTLIDDLVYQYTGNRLDKVIENMSNSTGYEGGNNLIDYDMNGSMVNMKDKGIQGIGYNYLSLPDQFGITQVDPFGTDTNFNLSYLYRTDGIKLRKTYSTGGGRGQATSYRYTDYLDGFQYSFSETVQPCLWCRTSVAYEEQAFSEPVFPGTLRPAWVLDFVNTAEGVYSFTENRYIYQYADHLGNIRVNYAKDVQGNLEITNTNNYYAFGMNHIGGVKSILGGYKNYKYNGMEIQESGMYDYGARFYMADIGRWGVVDPLAEQYRRWSPYNYTMNNPIRFTDPDGRGTEDFVQRKDGSIYWDNKANDQASTKAGETYLGKELTFNFTSYIDGKSWDGPLNGIVDASGVKLTSTLTLTGRENDAGELISLVGNFQSEPGVTPVGQPRMFYPGEGGSNNTFSMNSTPTGANASFEQHASVSPIEEFGLNTAGFKIVDVAQKLNINYNSSNGNLSVDAYTNIFPSATLKLNNTGTTLMQYNQPSFPGTHTAPVIGATPTPGGIAPKRDFSYYPSHFYKRN
ncbi:DUF6443 domain-containing protein [Chryseobacterium hagamense]|uniref:DUF6443 domain-containing protein n=1 Tax=Chryseobacterium hagamense TaxID=395935 RepID=A0A511YQN3_9FLAO|nr:DUF6443 domain-containing protein [Chryseobacterium hagamense]GEN77504.1 hypothetical protein CHA01nite_32440 [Chryseobacterium hagamense]